MSSPVQQVSSSHHPINNLGRLKWSFLVALHSVFVVAGLVSGTLLIRFYFEKGGKSKWMGSLMGSMGFPILLIPYFVFLHFRPPPPPADGGGENGGGKSSIAVLMAVYLVLGIILTAANILTSVSLAYLSASTFGLISTSQLAFISVFSYFINRQKMTALILNSVVILALSSVLLAVNSSDSGGAVTGVPRAKYLVAVFLKLVSSALFALMLSLSQLNFERSRRRKPSYAAVVEQMVWISAVATAGGAAGLFGSGEWRDLKGEMEGFGKGRVSYVMTVAWGSAAWQLCGIGQVGMVFVVSSLFTNVVTVVAFAVIPIAAVVAFRDGMDGVKVVSMAMAFWGLSSYLYQQYVDRNEDGRTVS